MKVRGSRDTALAVIETLVHLRATNPAGRAVLVSTSRSAATSDLHSQHPRRFTMKLWMMRAVLVLAVAIAPVAMNGCASKNAASGGAPPMGATATSLFTSLGGSNGVMNLANTFGVNLKANPAVTKFLDDAAIGGVTTGLYNTIANAGGIKLPEGSTDLMGALSGKGLDAAAVTGVSQSLMSAGSSLKLSAEQMTALSALIEPVTKSLMMGK
jgi:hypothetical protein